MCVGGPAVCRHCETDQISNGGVPKEILLGRYGITGQSLVQIFSDLEVEDATRNGG